MTARRIKLDLRFVAIVMMAALGGGAPALMAATNGTEDAASAPGSPADQPLAEAVAAKPGEAREPSWNWHVQNTIILQGDTGFAAKVLGHQQPGQPRRDPDTISLDLFAGARLWPGAEAHIDGLLWQGYGLSTTLGVEGFPSAEAYRLGVTLPNVTFARVFIRQTFGLGGEQEAVEEDALHLAGKQDVSRVTLTLGKMSAKDIFDGNAYSNDPRTQFMNWGLVANEAWDYPADSLGYETGFAVELNQPKWTVRYGFFQMPKVSNGMAQDQRYLEAWGMVTEFERRYALGGHPGAVRFLAYLNRANMGSFQAALDSPSRPADIWATREDRIKYGFGLNAEQEIIKGVGVFTRLGWGDGHTEAWAYADVDRTATLGVSVKGEFWRRPTTRSAWPGCSTASPACIRNSSPAGGVGILAGDGALNYGWEKVLETYYDFQIWKTLHGALDYQFVTDPAYNRDRGPVSIFGARLHWEF